MGVPMQDYFLLDNRGGTISSGHVEPDGRTIVLTLAGPSAPDTLTYVPSMQYYGPPGGIYEGPWIRNPRGIAAFTFQIPIGRAAGVGTPGERNGEVALRLLGASPNPAAHGARIGFHLAVPHVFRICASS
jgi:hypothetical protein